jgi:hypothetical protein
VADGRTARGWGGGRHIVFKIISPNMALWSCLSVLTAPGIMYSKHTQTSIDSGSNINLLYTYIPLTSYIASRPEYNKCSSEKNGADSHLNRHRR